MSPARHLAEVAAEAYPRGFARCVVVRNGVERADLSAGKRSCVLWYGREGAAKNSDDFERLVAMMPDRQFIAIGPYRLKREAPNVRQLGWVEHPEKLLAEVAVVLSTSLSEGSPNLCLQGLAHGTQVVGYDIAGLAELRTLAPSQVHLAPPGECEALRDAVERAFQQRAAPGSDGGVDSHAIPTLAEAAQSWIELLSQEVP